MRAVDVIEKKAAGKKLSEEEIAWMVNGLVGGEIPDYQMTAFLMAVRLNGMDEEETAQLTKTMMNSGDTADLSDVPGIIVDKHSTGGVGDSTTLVIAPLVAACGGVVAMMSGRGLAFSCGTLDKLETFPGIKVEQNIDDFKKILRQTGVAVIGQTGNLVPADKMIYALRDVTGTVKSIPLIASSIMSKKLASGTDAIVLDVKAGNGAFMQTQKDAVALAGLMVKLGGRLQKKVSAVVSDMNQPLGLAVGHALEVREAIHILSGMIPPTDRLYQMCLVLAKEMLTLSGVASSEEEAESKLQKAIQDGSGLKKFQEMVEAMGGDSTFCTPDGIEQLCKVQHTVYVYPQNNGYVYGINAEMIGRAAQILGAGRAKKEDEIDHSVGLVMRIRVGDFAARWAPMCTLYANDLSNVEEAKAMIQSAVQTGPSRQQIPRLIHTVIRDSDIQS